MFSLCPTPQSVYFFGTKIHSSTVLTPFHRSLNIYMFIFLFNKHPIYHPNHVKEGLSSELLTNISYEANAPCTICTMFFLFLLTVFACSLMKHLRDVCTQFQFGAKILFVSKDHCVLNSIQKFVETFSTHIIC